MFHYLQETCCYTLWVHKQDGRFESSKYSLHSASEVWSEIWRNVCLKHFIHRRKCLRVLGHHQRERYCMLTPVAHISDHVNWCLMGSSGGALFEDRLPCNQSLCLLNCKSRDLWVIRHQLLQAQYLLDWNASLQSHLNVRAVSLNAVFSDARHLAWWQQVSQSNGVKWEDSCWISTTP